MTEAEQQIADLLKERVVDRARVMTTDSEIQQMQASRPPLSFQNFHG